MASDNDREHFEDYRAQTAVKHEILAAYLPAFFHILKGRNENLVYIDGFAGRGTYTKAHTGEIVPGSPLRALELIAGNDDLKQRVSTIFIESDEKLFPQLETEVNKFYQTHTDIRKPTCLQGTFEEGIAKVLGSVNKLAPTFLFVDPCGVDGAKFITIKSVMDQGRCEAFIFFNIDGVRRIAGLPDLSPILIDLMGTEVKARAVFDIVHSNVPPEEKERRILATYKAALKEDMGVQRIITFRVEHEGKKITSHYLIHATKSPLGFRIMKDVMWNRGHDEDQQGSLTFAQSSRTNFIPMFDMRGDAIKEDVLKALDDGPRIVSTFYQTWPELEDNVYCESAYRAALLQLEAAGQIEVLSKDGKNVVVSASSRRKGTLAKDFYVRLANKTSA